MPTTVTITGTDPGSYVAPVLVPAAGTVETSAQMQIMTQALANQTQHLDNIVTDGTYTITCGGIVTKSVVSAATGSGDAGTFTGSGTGSGVVCVGGASGSGVGGRFTGGGTTGTGIIALGSGNASGIVATGVGATGRGGSFSANAASLAIACGTGNMAFSGAQPAITADPGFDNYMSGAHVLKAFATVDCASSVITVPAGVNVAGAAFFGTAVKVTLARAVNIDSAPVASTNGAYWCQCNMLSTTVVQIDVYTVTLGATAAVNLAAATVKLFLHVNGRQ